MSASTLMGIGMSHGLFTRDTLNSVWKEVPNSNQVNGIPSGSGQVLGITVMPDGTILGTLASNVVERWVRNSMGQLFPITVTTYYLATRSTLSATWEAIAGSGNVTDVAVMKNGTIIGIGLDNGLFTRATLKSVWVNVPNSGNVVGVAMMNDGKFLGIGMDNGLFVRDALNGVWQSVPNSGNVIGVTVMGDGTIVGIGMDNGLFTRATLNSPWVSVPDSGNVIGIVWAPNIRQ